MLTSGPVEGPTVNCPLARGGGNRRRLPTAYAAAFGRLPLCAPGHDPAAHPFKPAPLSAAAWHQPPEVEGEQPSKRKFKAYPIGYFHIDIAEVRTEEGRLYLLVTIDRTSKFAFVELHQKVTTRVAGDFLRHLIAAVPYKVHTVLTDHGIHFTTPSNKTSAAPLIKEVIERVPALWPSPSSTRDTNPGRRPEHYLQGRGSHALTALLRGVLPPGTGPSTKGR